MPFALTWADVGQRILLTVIASLALGWDRSTKGHGAGIKTTMLVTLAASLSMMQTNWLLGTVGKASDSFVTLDLMRLPLGILTGVGFIGGGAILKQKGEVIGLTTAATLWIATVIGLCFGGGQMALGVMGTLLALAALRGLRLVEARMRENRTATLMLQYRLDEFEVSSVTGAIAAAGLKLSRLRVREDSDAGVAELHCRITYASYESAHGPPPHLLGLLKRADALKWEWSE